MADFDSAATLEDLALSGATAVLPVLPRLLKAYWILASASVLLTLLPLPIPTAFKAAVRLAASRGKLWHTRPAALGALKDVSVPQQFFEHFYLLGALANTVALQVYIFTCCEETAPGATLKRDSLLALLLFEVHLLRRYAETSYMMFYPDSARMHIFAYLFGLTYYIAVPLTLLPDDVLSMNVIRNAWDLAMGEGAASLSSVDARLYGAVTATNRGLTRLAAGAALYLLASLLQFASHRTLGRLARETDERVKEAEVRASLFINRQKDKEKEQREKGGKQQPEGGAAAAAAAALPPGPALTDVYSIPRGGAFELVSCPHYLAEILIYASLALVTGGTAGTLLIGAWVLLNLVLAAGATHRWYRTQFPEYPRKRAALLPWIY